MSVRSVRRLERALGVLQLALVGGGCALLAWTVYPERQHGKPVAPPAVMESSAATEAGTGPSLSQLEAIWSRDLRQTLIEPPPKETPKPTPQPPPRPVKLPRLLATFVEHGMAWGVFVTEDGAVRVTAAGAQIGDCVVVAISPGNARLHKRGKEYDVSVPEPPFLARHAH